MNKYEVLSVIDEGAYGIVLKARSKQTGQLFAIKKFKDSGEDGQIDKTIQRQVKMLRKMRSQYVIDLKEAFRRRGRVYLVFEYMQKNVLQLIEQSGTGLQPQLIRQIIHLLVKSLHFLHSQGACHRDIKPQNLLLNLKPTFQLKLCDFGFTRYLGPGPLTQYVATRWYRSPQLLVRDTYSYQSDMWAVGCIMAELIDGEPLFPGENEIDQIYLIMRVFGPLTGRQQQALWRNFRGVCFPPIRQVQTLEMRYAGRVGVEEMRFMKGCLRLEPEERMTAEEALGHPYLLGGSMASNNMGVIGNASINMNMNMAEMMMRESQNSYRKMQQPSVQLAQITPRQSLGGILGLSRAQNQHQHSISTTIPRQKTQPRLKKPPNRGSMQVLPPQNIAHKLKLELFPSQAHLPRPKLEGQQHNKVFIHPNLAQVRSNVHVNLQANFMRKGHMGAMTLRAMKSNSQPFADYAMKSGKQSPDLLIGNGKPIL